MRQQQHPQLFLDPSQTAAGVIKVGYPYYRQNGVNTVTSKLSSLSDKVSPIGVVSMQQTTENLLLQSAVANPMGRAADSVGNVPRPNPAFMNFLQGGHAVVPTHPLSDKSQADKTQAAAVNKTISDSNQIRLEAAKKPSDIKLAANERKVGQYILGKSIGEGTFGKVKLGRHILTNEKVSRPGLIVSFEFLTGRRQNP